MYPKFNHVPNLTAIIQYKFSSLADIGSGNYIQFVELVSVMSPLANGVGALQSNLPVMPIIDPKCFIFIKNRVLFQLTNVKK